MVDAKFLKAEPCQFAPAELVVYEKRKRMPASNLRRRSTGKLKVIQNGEKDAPQKAKA